MPTQSNGHAKFNTTRDILDRAKKRAQEYLYLDVPELECTIPVRRLSVKEVNTLSDEEGTDNKEKGLALVRLAISFSPEEFDELISLLDKDVFIRLMNAVQGYNGLVSTVVVNGLEVDPIARSFPVSE